jgi:hypothetical protein
MLTANEKKALKILRNAAVEGLVEHPLQVMALAGVRNPHAALRALEANVALVRLGERDGEWRVTSPA